MSLYMTMHFSPSKSPQHLRMYTDDHPLLRLNSLKANKEATGSTAHMQKIYGQEYQIRRFHRMTAKKYMPRNALKCSFFHKYSVCHLPTLSQVSVYAACQLATVIYANRTATDMLVDKILCLVCSCLSQFKGPHITTQH